MQTITKIVVAGAAATALTLGGIGAVAIADDNSNNPSRPTSISVPQQVPAGPPAAPQQLPTDPGAFGDDWDDRDDWDDVHDRDDWDYWGRDDMDDRDDLDDRDDRDDRDDLDDDRSDD